MKSNEMRIISLFAAAVLWSVASFATPTLGPPESWSTPGNLDGWVAANVGTPGFASTVSAVANIGGSGSGVVDIMFPLIGAPSPDSQSFSTTAAGFIGDYSSGAFSVGFSFYAANAVPSQLSMFFVAADNNVWTYDVGLPSGTGAWSSFGAPMSYSAGWTSPGNPGVGVFNTDLATVDQIGIIVTRSGGTTGQEDYGIDDFGLSVPEPATYAVIAFSLLTLGLTLRRRSSAALQMQPS